MAAIEASCLKLGTAVVSRLASAWLSGRSADRRRGQDLVSLLADKYPVLIGQREVRRELDKIEEEIAKRIEPLVASEFRDIDDDQKRVILVAVADLLDSSSMSDELLLRADLDHRRLKTELSTHSRGALGFTASEEALFELVLEHTCWWLLNLIRELPEFSAVTAVEVLRRTSELMARLDSVQARLPLTSLEAPRGTTFDQQYRARYCSYLAQSAGFVELLGVTLHNFTARLPIEDAYLSLKVAGADVGDLTEQDELDSKTRWYSSEAQLQEWSDARRQKMETVLANSSRTLVFGEPGSGKSTLVQWLTVMTAKGTLHRPLNVWNGLVPFPIQLRSFVDTPLPSPDQFTSHCATWLAGLEPEGWTYRQLADKRCLLMLDGVDEVPTPQRARIKRWLRDLISSWPDVRIVVTARPSAATERWLADLGFRSVTIERLSNADVRKFVQRWHSSAAKSESHPFEPIVLAAHQKELLAILEKRSDLQALATNPLLCAMVCAVSLDRGGYLPEDRMAVYRAALEMLLERRDVERGIHSKLTFATQRSLLGDLAWRMTLNNRARISRESAVEFLARKMRAMPAIDVGAEDVLQHLVERSGVVREPTAGSLDFVHRTFQEYLAGAEAAEEDHIGVLVEHAHLDSWTHVIIMTCGHANRPQRAELLLNVLERADSESKNSRKLKYLLFSCLEVVVDLEPDLLNRIYSSLAIFIPPKSRAEADALGGLGRAALKLLPTKTATTTSVRAAALVRTAGKIGGSAALPLLRSYASDPRPEVQDELVEMWRYFNPQRYAQDVIREAPLRDGRISVNDASLIPYLTQLQALNSTDLSLFDDPVTDLSVLDGVPHLHSLHANAEGDISLKPLLRHRELKSFGVAGPARLRDLDVLAHLSELEQLTFFNRQSWSDIEFLTELSQLRSLTLASLEKVRDLSPLRALANLTTLQLHDTATVPDVGVFAHLGRQLEYLSITGAPGDDFPESLARTFPSLRYLFIIGFAKLDLSSLAGLLIEDLWIQSCPSVELAGASALRALRTLRIEYAPTIGNLPEIAHQRSLREVIIAGEEGEPLHIDSLKDQRIVLKVSRGREVLGDIRGGRLRLKRTS